MQIRTDSLFWYGLVTVALALLAWQAWRVLLRKSKAQNLSLQRSLDTQAEALAARWLSLRMNISESVALEGLKALSSSSAVASFWRDHSAHVHIVFEEVTRGNYQVTIRVSANEDDRMEQTRSITLDDLPDSIRATFMRGNASIEVRWKPAFEKEI